jgi:ATP-binding cassette subfamily C (CFTR/MRP) protein 1
MEVNLPQIFSQILTFAAFAIVAKVQRGDSLSVSVAITSLSILTLLSTPLAQLLYALPQGVAALGCFQRIQSFLLEEARQDNRIFPSDSSQFSADSGPAGADMVSHIDGIELISTINMHKDIRHKSASQDEPVVVSNGSFGWSEVNPSVIQNVQIQIPWSAQLTIIVGSVGCGKSTFLKAILGETSNMSGTMSLKYRDIAFCDQSPWIINDSIRNNIIGESEFDYAWYASVTRACALDVDLQRMPNHDATLLGSKGVILSGGQKQRLVS